MASKQMPIFVAITAVDKVTKVVSGVASGTIRQLRNIENASERMNARMTKAIKGFASTPLGGIATAAGALVTYEGLKNVYEQCTEAAKAQARAQRELNVIMTGIPGQTHKTVKAFEEYADQMESVYKVNHKSIMAAGAQMSMSGLSATTIEKLMPSLIGLTEYTTKHANPSIEEMTAAGALLGKAFIGLPRGIKGLGIPLTDAQQKLLKTGSEAQKLSLIMMKLETRRLPELAKLSAASLEGRQAGTANEIEKWKEMAGDPLLKLQTAFRDLAVAIAPVATRLVRDLTPGLEKAVTWVTRMIEKFSDWSKKNPQLADSIGKTTLACLGLAVMVGPAGKVAGALAFFMDTIGKVIQLMRSWRLIAFALSVPLEQVALGVEAISTAFKVGGIAAAVETAFAAAPVLGFLAVVLELIAAVLLWKRTIDEAMGWYQDFQEAKNREKEEAQFEQHAKQYIRRGDHSIREQAEAGMIPGIGPSRPARPIAPTGRAAIFGQTMHTQKTESTVNIRVTAPRGTQVRSSQLPPNIGVRMGYNNASIP